MIMNYEKSLKESWIQEKFFKPVLLLLGQVLYGLRIMPADLAYWRIIGLAAETEKARNGKKATTLGRCFKFEEQKPRS